MGNSILETIPTIETLSQFYFKDSRKDPTGTYGTLEKKEKKRWKLVVTKPCYNHSDDIEKINLKYDVMDFILHRYQVLYRKSQNEEYSPIRNIYLKNGISAYAVGYEGFWYVQNDYFCYFNKEIARNRSFGKIKNITDIEILPNGKIRLHQVVDIKEIEHNRFYSRQMGDFEGYEDEYEIELKTLIFDPAKPLPTRNISSKT